MEKTIKIEMTEKEWQKLLSQTTRFGLEVEAGKILRRNGVKTDRDFEIEKRPDGYYLTIKEGATHPQYRWR